MGNPAAFQASAIVKSFGAVHALRGADLRFEAGEIHALCGENGAGKSTLAKAACGVIPVNSGTFQVGGQAYVPSSPVDAARRGVSLIFQEPAIISGLTITENIYLGSLRDFSRGGFQSRAAMRRSASRYLVAIGAPFDVDTPWNELTVGECKMVEIARAIATSPKVLFVDETTAVLDATGRELITTSLHRLREQGVAICFVSHDLEEIIAFTDKVTVMRDGVHVGTSTTVEISRTELESLMVGREMPESRFPSRDGTVTDQVALSVNGVSMDPHLCGISLDVRHGEILGVAGLGGSGASELLRVLAGDRGATSGVMTLDGRLFGPKSPRQALAMGVCYLPAERDDEGLLAAASIRENIALASLPGSLHQVNRKQENAVATAMVRELRIKTPSIEEPVSSLSGGNRQKVVLAKLLAVPPRVLLLDNPTRGVDVNARRNIYQAIADASRQGLAVVILSEDLLELLGLADQIVVLHKGSVSQKFTSTCDVSEHDVLVHML